MTVVSRDMKLKEFRKGVADFIDLITTANKIQDRQVLSNFDKAILERVRGSAEESYYQCHQQVNRIKAMKNSEAHLRPTEMLLQRISVTSSEKEKTLQEAKCSTQNFDVFLRQAKDALDFVNFYVSARRSRVRHSSDSRSDNSRPNSSRQIRRRRRQTRL